MSDATVENGIKLVRQAVGDSGREQRIIQTFYGHGYRFIAPVAIYAPSPIHVDAAEAPLLARATPTSLQDSGERKVVSILCCSMIHPVPQAEAFELDTLHRSMQTLHDLAQHVSHRYGGTIQPITEQHLLIVFGAPVAQEDHAQRAVIAALALCRRATAAQLTDGASDVEPFEMRMGVHTGPVALGGIGALEDTGVAMVGQTVSLAIALPKHAGQGAILCSEATADLVRQVVRLEPCQALQTEEHPSPIDAYQIVGRHPRRSAVMLRARWAGRPFVGRERELATLHTLWTHVEAGQGQVVGIVGPPGMGKSRLVDTFRRSLRGRPHTYVQGRCLSYGQTSPYLPVRDLMGHACGMTSADRSETRAAKISWLLRAVGMHAAAEAPYLLHLWGGQGALKPILELPPKILKERLLSALRQLCTHGCQSRPLVLEIEDLHWIDPSSEACLAGLVDQLAGLPILLLVTYRPGYQSPWLDRSYATQVALTRLSSEDSQCVVQAALSASQVDTAVMREIVTKAEGNPFFLEELTRSVGEQKGATPLAVPDTMQAVLMSRLDRLSPAAKHLVQVAAVIGKEVPLAWLKAIVNLPEAELHQGLTALQSAEFLHETRPGSAPIYTFMHILTQEAAYQSLLIRPRQQYHRQIAEALSVHFPAVAATEPERLAHHYTEAGCLEQAIAYWQRAGQWAVERAAHVEAIRHLTSGLSLLKSLPAPDEHPQWELDLQLPLGAALSAMKGAASPDAEQVYVRAQALCHKLGSTPQLFDVLQGLVKLYQQRAELEKARELGQQLLALTQRQDDPAERLQSHETLGVILYHIGDMHAARMHIEQAIARRSPLGDLRRVPFHTANAMATGLSYAALILWQLGYPDQAEQRSREAVALAQELAHPLILASVWSNTAHFYLLRREMRVAQQWAETLLALAIDQGFSYWKAQAMMKRGRTLVTQGQGEAGMREIQQGLTAYLKTGATLGRPYNLALLAEAHAHNGQIVVGLDLVTEAFATVHRTEQSACETQLHRLKGKLLIQRGQREAAHSRQRTWQEAEESLRRSLVLSEQRHMKAWGFRAAMSLSRLWQQSGKREAAHQLLATHYGWFTEGFDTPDLRKAKALLEQLS